MSADSAGTVSVVTGAASGIGEATAVALLEEGRTVIAADMDGAGLERLFTASGDAPGGCVPVTADVTSGSGVGAIFEAAQDAGGCDLLINAAGVGRSRTLADHTEADWDFVMDVNVKGSFLCLQAAAPQMRAKGGGAIVNVASVVGLLPSPIPELAYDTSKGAVIQMTRSAAKELAPDGIRVNGVAPGPVPTNLYGTPPERPDAPMPLGFGEVADVVSVIMFLASAGSRWVTGQIVAVDGGWLLR